MQKKQGHLNASVQLASYGLVSQLCTCLDLAAMTNSALWYLHISGQILVCGYDRINFLVGGATRARAQSTHGAILQLSENFHYDISQLESQGHECSWRSSKGYVLLNSVVLLVDIPGICKPPKSRIVRRPSLRSVRGSGKDMLTV